MTLDFKVNFVSTKPLYLQIAVQLKQAIEQGKFTHGSPLPSVNDLSKSLAISKATPLRAYGYLGKKGLVKWEKGRGFFLNSAVATKPVLAAY